MLIAIDPGLSGGIVAGIGQDVVTSMSMPPTEGDIVDLLRSLRASHPSARAVLEDVPWVVGGRVNAAASGKLHRNVGVLRGALLSLCIPQRVVAPREWQERLRLGTRRSCASDTEWKNKLKAEAQRRYPDQHITLATADAFLIYDWAQNTPE